jgi:DNA polymerase III subunit delta'
MSGFVMSWQHIRGHEDLIQAFDHVVRRRRLAHAYLFTGPAGVGKRLFAEELAKALLCEGRASGEWSVVSGNTSDPGTHHSPGLEACDQCQACKLVDAGTHPDLAIAGRPEDKSELPIEVVRGLARFLDLKPARGRGRIVILDDADDLNEESANCFLKTLEEPPPGALLILVGTSPDRQLPTIVSRCQVIHFRPLSEKIVAGLLTDQGVDQSLISRLGQLSQGSMGLALALADPALWEFRRKLLEGLAQPQSDGIALAEDWTRFVEEAGKELTVQRRRAHLVLHLLIHFLKEALKLSVGKQFVAASGEKDRGEAQTVETGDSPLLLKLVKQVNTDRLLEMIDRCLEADSQIDRNVQLVLVLEALVDSLTSDVG